MILKEKNVTHTNECSASIVNCAAKAQIKAIKWNFVNIPVLCHILYVFMFFLQFKKANLCVFTFITLLSDNPIDIHSFYLIFIFIFVPLLVNNSQPNQYLLRNVIKFHIYIYIFMFVYIGFMTTMSVNFLRVFY